MVKFNVSLTWKEYLAIGIVAIGFCLARKVNGEDAAKCLNNLSNNLKDVFIKANIQEVIE